MAYEIKNSQAEMAFDVKNVLSGLVDQLNGLTLQQKQFEANLERRFTRTASRPSRDTSVPAAAAAKQPNTCTSTELVALGMKKRKCGASAKVTTAGVDSDSDYDSDSGKKVAAVPQD